MIRGKSGDYREAMRVDKWRGWVYTVRVGLREVRHHGDVILAAVQRTKFRRNRGAASAAMETGGDLANDLLRI